MKGKSQKIFVYSPLRVYGFETKDIKLVQELRNRGHEVKYAVTSNELYVSKKFGYPGFPDTLRNRKEFLEERIIWINGRRNLQDLILWCDLLVMGSCRVIEIIPEFVSFAKFAGKLIVVHSDHTDFGVQYDNRIDVLCMQSAYYKNLYYSYVLKNPRCGNLKLTKEQHHRSRHKEVNCMPVTGAVRMDVIHATREQRVAYSEFCERYHTKPPNDRHDILLE